MSTGSGTSRGPGYYIFPICSRLMAYFVAEPCVGCTFTDYVEVCPVDCFYVGPNFVAIHPDVCIDRNACVPVCPAGAIYPEEELPEVWAHYAEWNAYLAPRWQALGHSLIEKRPGSLMCRCPAHPYMPPAGPFVCAVLGHHRAYRGMKHPLA